MDNRPWEWKGALWPRPGEAVPEQTILASVSFLIVGLILLVEVMFNGLSVNGVGVDPHALAYAFVAAIFALGLLGVRLDIRQHRYGGGIMGPRRDARNR